MARTKGAVSCVLVEKTELDLKFGPTALIPVNARFARENNLGQVKPTYSTRENVQAAGEQPDIKEVD